MAIGKLKSDAAAGGFVLGGFRRHVPARGNGLGPSCFIINRIPPAWTGSARVFPRRSANRWFPRVLALEREDRLEAFRRLSLRTNTVADAGFDYQGRRGAGRLQVVYGHYELTSGTDSGTGGSRGVLRIGARILNLKRFVQGPEMEESGPVEESGGFGRRG